MDVREWLQANSEEEYRLFTGRLVESRYPLLGVRLPLLRQQAKELLKQYEEEALNRLDDSSFEMIMLQGFVIAGLKKPLTEKRELLYRHLLKCDNWSLIDSLATSFKGRGRQSEEMYDFISSLKEDEHPYVRRFVLVMMQKYLDDDHIADIMDYCRQLGNDEYCVEMATGSLSETAYRYARGKINDSYRITEEKKKEYREARNGSKDQ